ncbi:hypothetical protein C804_01292 [Lachnospiraceae bacterium A4]|nr:hypothetical protein C804_01292 [Lachnospiraceae bacterium A4]
MEKDSYYYYCKAEAYRQENQLETAIKYYLKSALMEEHFKTYARLYECYFARKQFDLANYFLTRSYQKNSNNEKVAFQYAMYLIQEKETASAKKILAGILKKNPTYKHAKIEFHKLEIQQKYQKLIQFLEEIKADYKRFLGAKSLHLLACYLFGFHMELLHIKPSFEAYKPDKEAQVYELHDLKIWDFLAGFQRWIELKYACKLTQSWSNILRFHTEYEEEAFDLFYQELYFYYQNGIFIECEETNVTAKDSSCYRAENIQIYGQDIAQITFKNPQCHHEFYQQLWKVLTMIKIRPYLMTGEKSLTQTNIFLRGYIDAYNRSHQEEPAQTFFPGFEKWVNQKERFKVYRPWHKIYLFITANEEDAFDLFYADLEEYLKIDTIADID